MDKNYWSFPESINIGGKEYLIRTNYEAVLDLLIALDDPEIKEETKEISSYIQGRIILEIMYPDCDKIPQEHWQEAITKACDFIDMGIEDEKKKPKTMDWKQDAPIIIPAINKALGYEVRNKSINTHWWTFLGAYMSIGESLFSNVLNIRQKKIKGKKLEKWEQEFYKENKKLIDFQQINKRSDKEKKEIKNYFYGHKNSGIQT